MVLLMHSPSSAAKAISDSVGTAPDRCVCKSPPLGIDRRKSRNRSGLSRTCSKYRSTLGQAPGWAALVCVGCRELRLLWGVLEGRGPLGGDRGSRRKPLLNLVWLTSQLA